MKLYVVKAGTQGWLHNKVTGEIKRWTVTKDITFQDYELISDPVRFHNRPNDIEGLSGIQVDQLRQGYSIFNPPIDSNGYLDKECKNPKYQLSVLYSKVEVLC